VLDRGKGEVNGHDAVRSAFTGPIHVHLCPHRPLLPRRHSNISSPLTAVRAGAMQSQPTPQPQTNLAVPSRSALLHLTRHRPSRSSPQHGKSALHWAAGRSQLGLIDKLLAKGADIDAQDEDVPAFPYLSRLRRGVLDLSGGLLSLSRGLLFPPVATSHPGMCLDMCLASGATSSPHHHTPAPAAAASTPSSPISHRRPAAPTRGLLLQRLPPAWYASLQYKRTNTRPNSRRKPNRKRQAWSAPNVDCA
jgi:hypothetical protein